METQLTTAEDIKSAAQEFEQLWQTLDHRYTTLRAMEAGPLKAAIALQYSKDLKAYLDAIDHSPLADQKRRLYDAYKYALGVFNRARKRAEIFEKYCKDVRSDWESERLRLVEAERREKEQQANLFAAEQRKAEARAVAPIAPITVVVDSEAGKPAGESLVKVWVPKRDENEEIVFTDLGAYLKWVAENPAMYHLVEHRYGKLKKLLTDNRGMLQPPGLVVEQKWEPRTLREATDD